MEINEMMRINVFTERLASAEPTPGGGGAAALVGAQAAALAEMAARITEKNPRYAQVAAEMADYAMQAAAYRRQLLTLIADDAQAFTALMAAWKQPADAPGRDEILRDASAAATEVPLVLAETAAAVVVLAERLLPRVTAGIRADAELAVIFGRAAVEGALYNVRINMESRPHDATRSAWEERVRCVLHNAGISGT